MEPRYLGVLVGWNDQIVKVVSVDKDAVHYEKDGRLYAKSAQRYDSIAPAYWYTFTEVN